MGAALSSIGVSVPSLAMSRVWLARPTITPSRMTLATGSSTARRVVSLMIGKTSRIGRPFASSWDQPVSDRATGLRERDPPLAVGGDHGVADARQRGREPGLARADRRRRPLPLRGVSTLEGVDTSEQEERRAGGQRERGEGPPDGRLGRRRAEVEGPAFLGPERVGRFPGPVHQPQPLTALDDPEGFVPISLLPEPDGLLQLGHLPRDDPGQVGDPGLLGFPRGEGSEPSQLAIQGRPGVPIRPEIFVTAGEQIPALAGLGVLEHRERAIEFGEEIPAPIGLLAGVGDRPEARGDQHAIHGEHRQRERVAYGDGMLGDPGH